MTRGTERSILLRNAILFFKYKIIFESKIQTVDGFVMPSSINYFILFLKRSKSLKFLCDFRGKQWRLLRTSYGATRNKKVHYSALQWHYPNSTLVLFSSIVPWFFCPESPLSTSNLNNFRFVCPFSKFFFSSWSYHLGTSTIKISENHDLKSWKRCWLSST